MKQGDADAPTEVDEDKKEITFEVPIDPYTPVAVLKAFVKMGLTLLPEEEVTNFRSALEWIRTKAHSAGFVFNGAIIHPFFPVIQTFFPGSYGGDLIKLFVFRRKGDDLDIPYAFMVLCYGNWMYQVFLPAPEREEEIYGKKLRIPILPGQLDSPPSP